MAINPPFTSDTIIIFTAISAVTFLATEIYRANFLFGETALSPAFSSSMSPGIRAGRMLIESSALFPDDVYSSRSKRPRGHMAVYDGIVKVQERLGSGRAAHIGHPCTRFVGAFEHMKEADRSAEEGKWAEEHIGSMTIDEFALELEANPDLYYNNHFRPMSDYLFSPIGTFRHDELLCQESTYAGLQKISTLTGRPASKELFGTPFPQNSVETCQHLSPESTAAIHKLYQRDYCIFGYDELPSDSPSCPQARMTKEALRQRYSDCLAAEETSGGEELIVHVWKQ